MLGESCRNRGDARRVVLERAHERERLRVVARLSESVDARVLEAVEQPRVDQQTAQRLRC